MSKFTAPAFQFYPKDWLSDPDVICMKLAERGAYITLLCFCWIKKTIPDDIPSLASLCGITPAEMEGIWPALKPCFKKSNPTGRLYNKRLAQERKAQKTRAATRTASGEKGAKKRWNKSRDIKEVDSTAMVLPMANDSSSSSSSSSTSISTPPTPSRGAHTDGLVDWLESLPYPKPIGNGDARAIVSVLENEAAVLLFRLHVPLWLEYLEAVKWSYGLEKFLFDGHWEKQPPKTEEEEPPW